MNKPSIDKWFEEARSNQSYEKCGMFLFHNGTVRSTPKSAVRPENSSDSSALTVQGMHFSYNEEKVEAALAKALTLPGIYFAKVWLNDGFLKVGDDIMLVMIGGDIRPRVIAALESLVDDLKHNCVSEEEVYK